MVIDEISMLNPEVFELLDMIAKNIKENNKPFGGIQLVVFGDFLQLPPVSTDKNERRFCFESPCWIAAGLSSLISPEELKSTYSLWLS